LLVVVHKQDFQESSTVLENLSYVTKSVILSKKKTLIFPKEKRGRVGLEAILYSLFPGTNKLRMASRLVLH
jgi:hypothetical protein